MTVLGDNNPAVVVARAFGADVIAPELRAKENPALNQIEALIAASPQIEFPLVHRFTPGLYAREIFMPAGSVLTSKIHKTEHPYVVTKGCVSVWSEGKGWERIEGPFVGITKPGTRRLLYIHKDTTWITFHPTNETDLAVIEQQLIEPHEIGSLMPGDVDVSQLQIVEGDK